MSQGDVAKRMSEILGPPGISRQALQQFETGTKWPHRSTLEAWLQVFTWPRELADEWEISHLSEPLVSHLAKRIGTAEAKAMRRLIEREYARQIKRRRGRRT